MDKNRKWVVSVGRDMDDSMQPGYRVYETFESELRFRKLNVELKKSGSFGISPGGAVVTVHSDGERWVYAHVTPKQVERIVEEHLVEGRPVQAWVETANSNLEVPLLALDARKPKSPSGIMRHHSAAPPVEHDEKTSRSGNAGENQDNPWMAMNFIGVGWTIALSVVLGIFGGIWLDDVLHTPHIFLLIGLAAGLAVAAYSVARIVKQQNDWEQKAPGGPGQKKPIKSVTDELAEVSQQNDKNIKEIREQGHELMEQAVVEAAKKQTQARSEMTEKADELVTQARARIAQDKAEAIAKLRKEYAELAAAAGLADDAATKVEKNSQENQTQGRSNG